jgi:hypothetical protein
MLMKAFGSTIPIHSMKACVLYEGASGRIHHIHSVMTLVGGREPSEREMADDAHGARRGVPNAFAGPLEVLHVSRDAIEPGVRYRVDTAKRALVVDR